MKNRKVTLKEGINGSKIKKFKGENGELITYNGESFTIPEFVSMAVYPGNVNYFTECLNALPISEGELKELKFYIDGEHIRFPENLYAKRSDSYQKILKNSLNIGKINEEIYLEGINLLKRFPKQLTTFPNIPIIITLR